MARHNDLGKLGEQLAIDYLVEKGYAILNQNYRFDKAEIDIIAKKQEILAIIEVKTRRNAEFGKPQSFVQSQQIKRIVKAAHEFVIENNLNVDIRFDIIAILKTDKSLQIDHIENAFYHF